MQSPCLYTMKDLSENLAIWFDSTIELCWKSLIKCFIGSVEWYDFLENCPVRLNPTRYSSMGHWITLWFHLLVVVAVLHLRVPTRAMHPNISSKRPNLCGNFINIKCGTIHYSISLLWRAGLVMCNSSQPEYQAKHCIA